MFRLSLLPLFVCSILVAQEVPQNVIDTGTKVSQALLKQLGSKLKHEMKTNGVLSAAKFCNKNAHVLTEEVNLHQLEGTSVKRISLKERNPANIPSEEEKEVLLSMQEMLEKKELPPYLVTHKDGHYKYYKPLVIKKPICLSCHGDISKNKELNDFMKEHYPQDKALGYKMNELRGAILVDIKP